MRNLIRGASAFLSLVAVAMAFLYGVQRENLVPHDTQMRGFINFQTANLGRAEIISDLKKISTDNHLGIYQLSTSGSTYRTDLLSRGSENPPRPIELSWLRPGREGALYSSSQMPDWNLSGPYVLRGDDHAIQGFISWLEKIHAVNRWDTYESWKLFVASMAYQGVVLSLLVSLVLLTSIVLAWYTHQYPSRSTRVLGGVSAARIHYEDSLGLMGLVVPPSLLIAVLSVSILVIVRGWVALVLVWPTLALLGAGYIVTALFEIAVSALTWPSAKRYALRRPIPRRFGWIADAMRLAVTVAVMASIPLLAVTLGRALTHTQAAEEAARLPRYYTVNFGGIIDEARDYEVHVPRFARLIAAQEASGEVGYSKLFDNVLLPNERFRSLVLYNETLFREVCVLAGCSSYGKVSDVELTAAERRSITAQLASRGSESEMQFWSAGGQAEPLAIAGSGIFTLAPQSLIVVVPRVSEFLDDETIVSDATRGMVMFRDGGKVVRDAALIGLNLTGGDVSQTVALYAADQRLGLQVAVGSLIILLACFVALALTSAFVHAILQAPKKFPKYLMGDSVFMLNWRVSLLDCIIILCPAVLTLIICWFLNLSATLPLLGVALFLMVLVVCFRNYAARRSMQGIIRRKG